MMSTSQEKNAKSKKSGQRRLLTGVIVLAVWVMLCAAYAEKAVVWYTLDSLSQKDGKYVWKRNVLQGRVLPIRRWRPKDGVELAKFGANSSEARSSSACNDACWEYSDCEIWWWRPCATGHCCSLYGRGTLMERATKGNHLSVTGALQRNAEIVHRRSDAPNTPLNQRVLLILNFHWEIDPSISRLLLEKRISSCLPSYFDITIIGPSRNIEMRSMVNPYTHDGWYSYLSVPLASTFFPGYNGYFLLNDDAVFNMWLAEKPETWFGNQSWANFEMSPITIPRPGEKTCSDLKHPWWMAPRDEDNESNNCMRTHSVLAELCRVFPGLMSKSAPLSCSFQLANVNNTTLPWGGMVEQADAFFVSNPNSQETQMLMEILVILAEHAVFLEIAVPLAFYVALQGSPNYKFAPLCTTFNKPDRFNASLWYDPSQCVVAHPLKFATQPHNEILYQHFVSEYCSHIPPAAALINATITQLLPSRSLFTEIRFR